MLDVGHLIELARDLANPPTPGAPKQVVLRRAVSTAYYAVFHSLSGHVATTFAPKKLWQSQVLFYRAIDHGKAKERCKKLGQNPLPPIEKIFFDFETFDKEIRAFANTFVSLQELRHRADYDPNYKVGKARAQQHVENAVQAIQNLDAAEDSQRHQFLAYIVCGLRNP
jgi:uncharacterized protein (UPF0332 family)